MYFFSWLTQSYWRDEAFSVILAQKPLSELLVTTAQDYSPPLYYLLLSLWMRLGGTQEIYTRLLSTLFSLATVIMITIWLRRRYTLTPWKTSALIIIFITSPALAYYATESRMYSLVIFLTCLSWISVLERSRKVFIIVSILALLTHYSQIFIMMSQFLWMAVMYAQQHKSKHTLGSYWNGLRMTEWCAIVLAYMPWIVMMYIYKDTDGAQSFWVSRPTLEHLWMLPGSLVTSFEYVKTTKTIVPPIALATTFAVLGLWVWSVHKKYNVSDLFAYTSWFLLPGMILFFLGFWNGPSLFYPRYYIVAAPALIFLVAYALSRIPDRFTAPLVLATIGVFLYCQQFQFVQYSKKNFARMISTINPLASSRDNLYLESELDFHLAQHYFINAGQVFIINKTYEDIPQYVGKSMIESTHVLPDLPDDALGWYMDAQGTIKSVSMSP